MISAVFAFLQTKLGIGVGVGLLAVVAVSGVWGVMTWQKMALQAEINNLEADINDLTAKNNELKAANDDFADTVASQNEQIAKLSAMADQRNATARAGVQSVNRQTETFIEQARQAGHGPEAMNQWLTDTYSQQ